MGITLENVSYTYQAGTPFEYAIGSFARRNNVAALY